MVAKIFPKRFDVYWTNLDPTIDSEVQKTRPCVIISPDSMNEGLNTVIIVPMTTTRKNWPFRIPITHKDTEGQAMLDQLRTVSKKRLHRQDGTITCKAASDILDCLRKMFTS